MVSCLILSLQTKQYYYRFTGWYCSVRILQAYLILDVFTTGVVFPNPTTGKVNVKCPELYTEYEIKNLQGQTIFNEEIKGGKTEFDLSEYKRGMFLLILKSTSSYHIEKISIIKW